MTNDKGSHFPIIELIGIYKMEGFPDVCLIELLINLPPNNVDISYFMQKNNALSEDLWQVAYDEHYLNIDGTKVIGMFGDQHKLMEETHTRIAFFMHFVDFEGTILSQYGEIRLMKPVQIPERLSKIISYQSP